MKDFENKQMSMVVAYLAGEALLRIGAVPIPIDFSSDATTLLHVPLGGVAAITLCTAANRVRRLSKPLKRLGGRLILDLVHAVPEDRDLDRDPGGSH